MILAVLTARLLPALLVILLVAGCNRNQQGVICAPLAAATVVRVSQTGNGPLRQFEIGNRYQVQALMDFANGRRDGFSARRSLPSTNTSATFYNGSQSLLTFSAGPNFFSLSCSGYAGVQEANRVQIAEFERLLTAQP